MHVAVSLSLHSIFRALRPSAAAGSPTQRWAVLAASYTQAKAAAVEAALPPDAGLKRGLLTGGPLTGGPPAALERRRSLGLKPVGGDTFVALKREVF